MTVITSSNYWNVLFTEIQNEVEENGRMKYLLIEKKYKQAVERAEERIRFFYGKNAVNNRIPLKLAYRKLDKEQLEQFHDLIEQYIKWWDNEIQREEKVSEKDTSETDVINDTETWINTLHEYQKKEDITYFEALSVPIINEIEKVSHETSNHLLELLVVTGWFVFNDVAKNLKIKTLAQEQVKKELLKSWAKDDLNLYDRFNSNKAKLSATVKGALVKGFKNELSVDNVVAEVSKVMEGGQFAAKRLVTTENTHFNCYSTMLAMKRAGYEFYKINAVIDSKTCEDCIDWNGDIYPISEYSPNVTAPPQHSHCRCFVTPANLKEIK